MTPPSRYARDTSPSEWGGRSAFAVVADRDDEAHLALGDFGRQGGAGRRRADRLHNRAVGGGNSVASTTGGGSGGAIVCSGAGLVGSCVGSAGGGVTCSTVTSIARL